MRRRVGSGEQIPRWYGVAWFAHDERVAVCYPIPLNWLAGWSRRAHHALVWGPRDPLTESFDRGLAQGRRIGYDHGYVIGHDDGMRQMLNTVRAELTR